MSRTGRAAKGFLTALLQYFVQILIQILLAPLVLKAAGRETLGAYAALMQALMLLSLIDVAGSWSLDRFLAQASGLDDQGASFRKIFTTARTVLLLTNILFAVLIVVLSFFLQSLFHLSSSVASEARHAFYVLAVWAVARTPFAAYSGASLAKQDIAAMNLIGTLLGMGRSVASLLFVLGGGGLFGLMLSGTVVEACGSFLYRLRFKRMHPELMPGWGVPDRALLKRMLSFGSYAMFMNIGNRLFLSTANLLAGLTNGAVATSAFYTSQMPAMTGYNMLYRLTESSTPAIHEIYGRGDRARLRRTFVRLCRLMLMMTFPLALGVLLFNRDLVTCWVGPQLFAGRLLTDTLALYIAVSAIQGIAILFAFVFGWVRLLAATSLLQGVANLGLGFYLGKRVGLGGVTLALVIVLLPQSVILLRKLGREFEVRVISLLGAAVARASLPLLAAASVGLLIHPHVLIRHHAYLGLVEECGAFLSTYALGAYFMVMTEEDRADTRRYWARLLRGGRSLQQRVFGTV